jgi:hypothetical protein
MSTHELVLAFLLLTAPPSVHPEASPPAHEWPLLQEALQQLAIDWEILDRRETKYILAKSDEFGVDLNLLRRRYQELQDAPKVADVNRFPDRNVVNERLKFNRAFRRNLDTRQILETDRASQFQTILTETDDLYAVWDAVRDARCEFYNVTVRRQALKKLQELIGDEAYHLAELPPVVPEWRFVELP